MTSIREHTSQTPVMAVTDLHGRPVVSSTGERIGVVRGVSVDSNGRIVSLDVRERWLLGPHHQVPAAGMRLEDGEVVVTPRAATFEDVEPVPDPSAPPVPDGTPVLLAGRAGASGRFGGLDLLGSLVGALVTIGSLVVVGGLLAAVFGVEPMIIDTSLGTFELVTTGTMLVGGLAIFLSFLLGGWATGRSARFDGTTNGLIMVLWVLGIGVVLGALGAWAGDEYDVFSGTDLPSFSTEEFAGWGSAAFLAALVLMLLGAAVGGALGEAWHRRADRAMLDVVAADDIDTSDVRAGHGARPVDD